jgi:uncharacterized protein (DUF2252 family)
MAGQETFRMKPKKTIPELETSPFAPVEPVDEKRLSASDRDFLDKEEAIIRAGRRSFLDVAAALIRIRDYKGGLLYMERYGSFEAYCQERWEFGQSYAYRLMGAAQIVAELSPRGEKGDFTLPATEKQVRALALLDTPEDRRKAWAEALQQAGEAEVPSRLVSRVVQGMIQKGKKRRSKKRVSKEEPEKLQIGRRAVATIRQRLSDIRKAAKGAGKIIDAVAEIEALLPN